MRVVCHPMFVLDIHAPRLQPISVCKLFAKEPWLYETACSASAGMEKPSVHPSGQQASEETLLSVGVLASFSLYISRFHEKLNGVSTKEAVPCEAGALLSEEGALHHRTAEDVPTLFLCPCQGFQPFRDTHGCQGALAAPWCHGGRVFLGGVRGADSETRALSTRDLVCAYAQVRLAGTAPFLNELHVHPCKLKRSIYS